jgi:hypothetical protein
MKNAILEFKGVIDEIFGVYLDSNEGFRAFKKMIEDLQIKMIPVYKREGRNVSIEDMDKSDWIYFNGDPRDSATVELHRILKGELKKRNEVGGKNSIFIGCQSIVTLYQFWEDKYRGEIAKLLGYENKRELGSDLFGDIRYIRIAIIHKKGIADSDVENKTKIIKWFKEGDLIQFNLQQFKQIIDLTYEEIDKISNLPKKDDSN